MKKAIYICEKSENYIDSESACDIVVICSFVSLLAWMHLSDFDCRLIDWYTHRLAHNDPLGGDPELAKELENPASEASERLREIMARVRYMMDPNANIDGLLPQENDNGGEQAE